MTMLDLQTSVGELVKERPSRARIFELNKIDYCCGGKLPLSVACANQGLDAEVILSALQAADLAADARDDAAVVDADAMTLTELADHIEQTHHAFVRSELPRLDQMTGRVHQVHGSKDARLGDIRRAFVAIREELTSHMMKEEEILFPMIRQMESGEAGVAEHCGSISNPIRMMEAEHEYAGDALKVMSGASDGYTPPEWACNTYRAMLDGLQVFEKDLHQHIHKENNVLFPKAIALEGSLASS